MQQRAHTQVCAGDVLFAVTVLIFELLEPCHRNRAVGGILSLFCLRFGHYCWTKKTLIWTSPCGHLRVKKNMDMTRNVAIQVAKMIERSDRALTSWCSLSSSRVLFPQVLWIIERTDVAPIRGFCLPSSRAPFSQVWRMIERSDMALTG